MAISQTRERSRQELLWEEKLELAQAAGEFLARLVPMVRGVAVTGSVAYGDVREDDDLDLLIITAAGRVYTTRLLCYGWALVRGKKRTMRDEKNKWCLNMFLDETCLLIPESKRTNFARCQIERMKVIVDEDGVFADFFRINQGWMDGESDFEVHEREVESGKVGDIVEKYLRVAQQWWMRPKITREVINDKQIFFQPLVRE